MSNRDDIIRIAREAGLPMGNRGAIPLWDKEIELFAELVISDFLQRTGQYVTNDASRDAAIAAEVTAERKACADVAKAISDKYAYGYYGNEVDTADEIEAAILARGEP